MTQEQLAEIAGVSKAALQLFETGKTTPSPTSLKRLAKALQLPTTSLYSVPPSSAVGDRVRFQRKSLGLTQVELAHLLGVKVALVKKWETGVGKAEIPAVLANWLQSEA